MLKFNDYLKEAALSAKQKKIAAIAGDKDKIDADDLAALRAGKKPVDECDYGKMKKEELVGKQHKLDKNHNGKLDAQDFKMLRKEAKDGWSENDSLAKPVTSSQAMADHSKYFTKVTKLDPKTGEPIKKDVKEEVEELDEGRVKELAMDLKDMSHDEFHKTYGHPKHHFDPTNFKKPVQPGHGMDRAKALAQRGMQSLSKEEVERIEEKLSQLDELSPATLKSYKKGIYRDLDRAADAYPHGTGDDDEDRKLNNRVKGDELADKKLKAKGVNPYSEEIEHIDELSKKTLGSYATKAQQDSNERKDDWNHDDHAPYEDDDDNETEKGADARKIHNRDTGVKRAIKKLAKEERDYVSATLKVMDEGKIDNLRDAQKLRQDTQSAYEKDYKPDTSHPHIQVVKGSAYGGANQKDDEGDEKPDDESKEKRGRGRPAGSKSGARQKGGGHEDGGIPVHNLNLPKSYK